ncbi:MAG TPA: DOMON-like domain-containing protein [Steroidobacteraceae bacterium]|nr:DOMON-like domain-containing protein [Steroidobacteraceae bacterium]
MDPSQAHRLALAPHPSTPSDAVRAIEARVARAAEGVLTFRYAIEADVSRVRLPPPRSARRADGLWRHTCLEAFIAPSPGPAYLELNFSPTGEWAGYAFSAYRTGMSVAAGIEPPSIAVERGAGGFTLDAAVGLRLLRSGAAARVGLAAVIEDSRGSLSYWALEHPPGKPDFHHPCGFGLQI